MSRPNPESSRFLRTALGLAPPLLLFCILLGVLAYALRFRLRGEELYEELILREWAQEARVYRQTLPELVRAFLDASGGLADPQERLDLRESIREHLAALGEVSRAYQPQLPLFPQIYTLELRFIPAHEKPIRWDSRLPTHSVPLTRLTVPLLARAGQRAELEIAYQLHAYAQRQEELAAREARLRSWMSLLAIAAAVVAVLWIMVYLRSERRQEAERGRALRIQEESARRLLEQRLATQEAERQALALKSQLYANIGIMAGSYAHNIKNMMVRPNDLLQRALHLPGQPDETAALLQEALHSLRAVGERTQEILKTVRSDPAEAKPSPIDLGELLRDVGAAWSSLAAHKWKCRLSVAAPAEPLIVQADRSHLQQALENLIFNARDAAFEKRAKLRDDARLLPQKDEPQRRQALIAAAEWLGEIELSLRREGDEAVFAVRDNGAGMPPEVQERCLETHYTTKRGSALHEGGAVGMGLGLAFVRATTERHGGRLRFWSNSSEGTTFEIRLPMKPRAADTPTAEPRPAAR